MGPRRLGWNRLVAGALVTIAMLAGAQPASADWNPAPIAVPLLGTTGAGSPYPSRITPAPPGGPTQASPIQVTLHNVTHPCPEDLVVLLVHDGTGYLLMANAGGCRPLQGTSITFTSTGGAALPDNPVGGPFGAAMTIIPSVYGAAPMLPSPAPPGPYAPLPALHTVGGNWDLYVMDQAGSSRGVIAAGWSLHYNTRITVDAPATPIAIPTLGAMAPIAFDYSGASPTARVRGVDMSLILSHTFPDDLEMVLQSPSGTTAIVMADAGGSADLVNTALVFRDTAASLPPDGTLISSGSYRPGASVRHARDDHAGRPARHSLLCFRRGAGRRHLAPLDQRRPRRRRRHASPTGSSASRPTSCRRS